MLHLLVLLDYLAEVKQDILFVLFHWIAILSDLLRINDVIPG